jgi:hypothetical protein
MDDSTAWNGWMLYSVEWMDDFTAPNDDLEVVRK